MGSYYLSDELVFAHAFYAVRDIREYLTIDETNAFRKMLEQDVFAEIDATPGCTIPKRVYWQCEVLDGERQSGSSFFVTDDVVMTSRPIDDERLYVVTLCVGFDEPLRKSLPKTRKRFHHYISKSTPSLEESMLKGGRMLVEKNPELVAMLLE